MSERKIIPHIVVEDAPNDIDTSFDFETIPYVRSITFAVADPDLRHRNRDVEGEQNA